ncbi:hypothetical protein [Streptomyces sp. SAS_276]|uniref:hypothetical protein n=1 Tax=Streptomyces sp. SAS_276 TaxID=3412745 RepID=UPI00403D2116
MAVLPTDHGSAAAGRPAVPELQQFDRDRHAAAFVHRPLTRPRAGTAPRTPFGCAVPAPRSTGNRLLV